jgi:hypothetical protein
MAGRLVKGTYEGGVVKGGLIKAVRQKACYGKVCRMYEIRWLLLVLHQKQRSKKHPATHINHCHHIFKKVLLRHSSSAILIIRT